MMNAHKRVLRLTYGRHAGSETFDGTLSGPDADSTFTRVSFETVMKIASDALTLYPDCRLVLKRAEAPYPMALPAGIENLLRTDFPAAMRILTIPAQRIAINPGKAVLVTVLKHGINTLSEALGDEIYVKLRTLQHNQQIENPVTGRWTLLEETASMPKVQGVDLFLHTRHTSTSGLWGTVLTQDLLRLVLYPRFYLPRGWNPSNGWISREDLASMYANYQKEKAECLLATGV